jgi:hypothetical protein
MLADLRDILKTYGPVAQLGARFHGMEEVVSSNLTRSTKHPTGIQYYGFTPRAELQSAPGLTRSG